MSRDPRFQVHYHYYPQDTGQSALGTCLVIGYALPVGLFLLFLIIGALGALASIH